MTSILKNEFCTRFGMDVPIVLAPMGGAVTPELAGAVSNAGGLALLPLWAFDVEKLRDRIAATRALTSRPFGVNFNLYSPQTERIAATLDEGVKIISLFWGDPAPHIDAIHKAGAVAFHTVSSASEAKRALALGVDVIVAQGWESGGHLNSNIATMPLVPAVVDAVAPTPVVAAGGIADGRGLAAALALGASAAWIGTRFLAANEASIHPRYREALINGAAEDTVHTELFDIGWPNAPHRVFRNETYTTWDAAGRPPSGKRPNEGEVIATSKSRGPIVRYRPIGPTPDTEGNIDAMPMWTGQDVGLLHKIQPASEIVSEIVAGAEAVLARLHSASV